MRTLRSTKARRGFTILEVVLALGILLIGVTVILGLLTFGATLTHAAHSRTAAANVVEAVVADLEEGFFPLQEDGSAGEPTAIEDRPLPGFETVTYSATPVLSPDDPLQYRVDVSVSWESGGVVRGHEFSTLLTREVPFGERMRRRFVDDRPLESGPSFERAGEALAAPGTSRDSQR